MSDPTRHDHLRLGAFGEDRAARWYQQHGYTILARNWRCPDGELDLVVAIGRDVAVCEVKTRSSLRYGSPLEAVGWDKQRRVRRLGARWVREEAPFRPTSLRFDAASVLGGRVEVVQGAF